MYKGWAIKLALALRPLMINCASPLTAAMIITVAAQRIVPAHGSKPTELVSSLLHSPQYITLAALRIVLAHGSKPT
jgi:hypothetical protein